MSLQSNTKNPYIIQFKTFETPTACNCSDDGTCEQCVDENTEGFLPNPIALIKGIVAAPKNLKNKYKAVKSDLQGSGHDNATITVNEWRAENRIHEVDAVVAYRYIKQYGKKQAREMLIQRGKYSDRKQRKLNEKHATAEAEEEAQHQGVLARLVSTRHKETTQQRRQQELEHAKSNIGRQAPHSTQPHGYSRMLHVPFFHP